MEPRRRKWSSQLLSTVFILLFLLDCDLFSSGTTPNSAASADVRSVGSSDDCYPQALITRTRRQLRGGGGPGSYPPRCTGKCGSCAPCFPVHVPVPPGTPVTTEYYPEAWRCKCGNRLFMP